MYSHKLSDYFKAFKPWYQLRNLFFKKHSETAIQNFRSFGVSTFIPYTTSPGRAVEAKNQAENALLRTRNLANIKKWRKNWRSFITTEIGSFIHSSDTGIRNIVMKISNKTSETIDYVQVRILYLEKNGRLYKSEYSELFGVQPSSVVNVPVYDSPKDCSLKMYITHVVAKAIDLEYCQDLYE